MIQLENFRPLIPVVLNRKVYMYLFDPGTEELVLRIPMRKYTSKNVWSAVYRDVTFLRRTRRFIQKVEREVVTEVYYTVLCPSVVFIDSDSLSPIPITTM